MTELVDVKQTTLLYVKPAETRQSTDQFFIILLPLSLSLWLGIVIEETIKDRGVYEDIWKIIFTNLCPEYLAYALLAMLILLMLLKFLSMMGEKLLINVMTFFIVVVMLVLIGCLYFKFYWVIYCQAKYFSYVFQTSLALLLIYNVAIFVCTKEVNLEDLGPMIQQPFRSIMRCFLHELIFYLIILSWLTFFSVSTMTLSLYLAFNTQFVNERFELNLLAPAFFLSGLYIFNFIWNFGFMVMANYYAIRYVDEQARSVTFVAQSIDRVIRYHIGTVAFLSTPILPSICALIMSIKKYEQPGKQSKYILINIISKINLIINIAEYASVQTLVCGTKSFKSIRQMIDLHHSNQLIFLTLDAVPMLSVGIGTIITMFLGWFTAGLVGLFIAHLPRYVQPQRSDPFLLWCIFTFYYATYLVYAISTLLLRPATCTFSVNKTIEEQREMKIIGQQQQIKTSIDDEIEPAEL